MGSPFRPQPSRLLRCRHRYGKCAFEGTDPDASLPTNTDTRRIDSSAPHHSRLASHPQTTTVLSVPVFYECQRCTACCRWPGVVRLSDLEITRLASFRELTEFEFIQQYTRLATDRRGLVLNDNQNGECIFLKGEDCSVQPVKPQQCRDFPNLWNFPGFEKTCRAIPKILSAEEYQNALERSRSATPQTPPEVAPLPPTIAPTTVGTPASTDTTFKPFAAS